MLGLQLRILPDLCAYVQHMSSESVTNVIGLNSNFPIKELVRSSDPTIRVFYVHQAEDNVRSRDQVLSCSIW